MTIRRTLILLNAFLALTALAGGLGLITGTNAPPLDMLSGSPFHSYLVPGLALVLVVGGGALVATIALGRQRHYGTIASGLAGAAIVIFEVVQVLVIGSPVGPARNLQLLYAFLGIAIVVLSAVLTQQARQSA